MLGGSGILRECCSLGAALCHPWTRVAVSPQRLQLLGPLCVYCFSTAFPRIRDTSLLAVVLKPPRSAHFTDQSPLRAGPGGLPAPRRAREARAGSGAARGGAGGGSGRAGAGRARQRRERGRSPGIAHHGGDRSGRACGGAGGAVGEAPGRGEAAVAGLAAGQGAAGGQCGVALRHDHARLPAAQRAAAALRPPRAPGPRLPLQPVRSPGKLHQR